MDKSHNRVRYSSFLPSFRNNWIYFHWNFQRMNHINCLSKWLSTRLAITLTWDLRQVFFTRLIHCFQMTWWCREAYNFPPPTHLSWRTWSHPWKGQSSLPLSSATTDWAVNGPNSDWVTQILSLRKLEIEHWETQLNSRVSLKLKG